MPDVVRNGVVAAYGIPAGRWPEVDAAWLARAATDASLSARFHEI